MPNKSTAIVIGTAPEGQDTLYVSYPSVTWMRVPARPRIGLPIVLLSAKLTTQRILKETGTISVQNMMNAVAAARA